jgi:hypothetical protein
MCLSFRVGASGSCMECSVALKLARDCYSLIGDVTSGSAGLTVI